MNYWRESIPIWMNNCSSATITSNTDIIWLTRSGTVAHQRYLCESNISLLCCSCAPLYR
jgi:hypothetical protein